jgi:hypothetical protein
LPTEKGSVRNGVYFKFNPQKSKGCTLLFASKQENPQGVRYMISCEEYPRSTHVTSPVDGVAHLRIPSKWLKTEQPLTLRIGYKRTKGARIADLALTDPSEKNPFVAPVGGYAEEVRVLPMGEIRRAYHGECCFVGPTGFRLYLHDIIPIGKKSDIGRSFRIRFEARCQNDRMLQARVIERIGSEEHMDFYNDAALLEPMYADRWSSYAFTYTVTDKDCVKREHRKSSILLLATSNGIREEEFCLRNFVIEEITDVAEIDLDTVRIAYDV